jgi:hypothetical protein
MAGVTAYAQNDGGYVARELSMPTYGTPGRGAVSPVEVR